MIRNGANIHLENAPAKAFAICPYFHFLENQYAGKPCPSKTQAYTVQLHMHSFHIVSSDFYSMPMGHGAHFLMRSYPLHANSAYGF